MQEINGWPQQRQYQWTLRDGNAFETYREVELMNLGVH